MPKFEIKIKITPSQALLLQISSLGKKLEKHQKELDGDEQSKSLLAREIQVLKILYLSGAQTKEDKKKLEKYLSIPNFKIQGDAKTINNDPTRRYFETHLAYQTLAYGLDDIRCDELDSYCQAANKVLNHELDRRIRFTSAEKKDKIQKLKLKIERVLNGQYVSEDSNIFKEYANYIDKLKSTGDETTPVRMYVELSSNERMKIELLTKCAFLGVMCGKYVLMPLNIYGQGFYSDEQKGKKMKDSQETTRTTHLGLMKSFMPLPIHDIAQGTEVYPYLKPSDQATFISHTKWVKHNFLHMVHPYSNSISGTMLCQLRLMAYFRNSGREAFTGDAIDMSRFIKLLVSSLLYNGGGHTLFEFIAPLSLAAVKEEFASTPDFSDISMESMFLADNVSAFDDAIDATIQFNNVIITRQILHEELKFLLTLKLDMGLLLKNGLKRIYSTYEESEKENTMPSNKRSR